MEKASENPEKSSLTRLLRKESKKNKANIWKRIAKLIEKPKRKRISVNLSKISRYTQSNDKVVIPGKVLSTGRLSHPVVVAALCFSYKARIKIEEARGKCLSLQELVSKNPQGREIRIIV